ncbi:MAG: regulatory protein RecX [Ruminococcus sp.]|nr:regulatory protein RecX [Ruminococcus sp.]
MKITSLRKYKGTTYETVLDGVRKIYLHIDIITDYALSEGMEIDRETLRKVIYASNFRRAYQYALYRLDYRDYSAEEMYQKLLETYKSDKLCLAVIQKLASAGLIDDERFAGNMARRLVEGKKYGFYRAKREITMKGITQDTAEAALADYKYAFQENLRELLETKYARSLSDSSDRKAIEKVKNALVRYGYSFTEVNSAVREYFEERSSEE